MNIQKFKLEQFDVASVPANTLSCNSSVRAFFAGHNLLNLAVVFLVKTLNDQNFFFSHKHLIIPKKNDDAFFQQQGAALSQWL